jgi:hypothetical protein
LPLPTNAASLCFPLELLQVESVLFATPSCSTALFVPISFANFTASSLNSFSYYPHCFFSSFFIILSQFGFCL